MEDVIAPAVPADGEEFKLLLVVPVHQVAPVDLPLVVSRNLGKPARGTGKGNACEAKAHRFVVSATH